MSVADFEAMDLDSLQYWIERAREYAEDQADAMRKARER